MTKLTRKERRIIGRRKRKLDRILKRQGLRAYLQASFSWKPVYRTYDQQRELYERWKAQGRGAVAFPKDDYHSSHHFRGPALDVEGWR